MTLPSLSLSPTLARSSFTVPAAGDGTSIVALSDSSVTSGSSTLTVSPAFTNTSMTGTSLKSPISGTLTSCVCAAPAFAGAGDGCGAAAACARAGAVGCAFDGVGPVDDFPPADGDGAPAPAPSVSSVRITPPSLTLSDLKLQVLDDAGRWRRNVHRRLVGFERD